MEPENLHATCNKILFENSLGPGESWEDCIATLDRLVPEELDEKVKLAITYCELMEDERAYRILQTVLEEMPYDARTLFLMGASAANTGRYAEAFDYFMDMIKIDPENTIALYYKNLVQEVCDGKRESVRILYAYQVPMEEIRRRMAFINASLQKGTEELQRLWREDEVFSSLLVWGLSLGELSVKRAVLDIIGNFADKKAEGILRRYLLRRSEPDPAKNDALLALRRMGASQPYIAYISGKITEIRVGMVEDAKTRLYPSSQKVLERIIEGADILNAREIMPFALEIFGRYISAQKPCAADAQHQCLGRGYSLYLPAPAFGRGRMINGACGRGDGGKAGIRQAVCRPASEGISRKRRGEMIWNFQLIEFSGKDLPRIILHGAKIIPRFWRMKKRRMTFILICMRDGWISP